MQQAGGGLQQSLHKCADFDDHPELRCKEVVPTVVLDFCGKNAILQLKTWWLLLKLHMLT